VQVALWLWKRPAQVFVRLVRVGLRLLNVTQAMAHPTVLHVTRRRIMAETKTYTVHVELEGGVEFEDIEITDCATKDDAERTAMDQAYDRVREMSLSDWLEVAEVEAKEKRCTDE